MAAMKVADVIARIRAYRARQGWSILRLATEAGLGESTIRKMDRADWNPTKDILERIEAVIPADFDPNKPDDPATSEAA